MRCTECDDYDTEQKTQEASAIMRLARQIALPGNGLTIPVITADPSADWVDETDDKPVSTPTLSQKIMRGYKLAVIVPFSNQFRRDLPALYDQLVQRLPLALAKILPLAETSESFGALIL